MSDSSRPHGLQPTRLLCPWDFPGKSTGVGCHCLLQQTHRCRQRLIWLFPFHGKLSVTSVKEMGIPDHLTCLLRNLFAGQEATVRTGHGTTDWFQIGKGVRQGCILSPCLVNFYAWKIPWMEEPGRLHVVAKSQARLTSLSLFTFMHWRRKWQRTPVFLLGKSQEERSLVGCHLWGRTESDTTEET